MAIFGATSIWNGLKLVAKTVLTGNSLGDIEVSSVTNKVNFHNGTTSSPVVTEAHAATLTHKTIDADGAGNSITNIENADIKAGAAIDAAKIADGSVSSTEFQYINSLSSNAQTQLTANATAISDHLADPTDAHAASAISNTPAGGISSTNVQSAINELDTEKQPLDSDLTALAALSTTGVIARTGSGTVSTRTITGTSNKISVSNGDGVSGDPTITIVDSAVLGGSPTTTTQSQADGSTKIATTAYVDTAKAAAIAAAEAASQPLDSDLTAVAGLSTTGLIARTGSGTASTRTITGTSGKISVSNGDGVSGNPTVTIADDLVLPGTGSVTLPSGTTAQRPGSPTAAMLRYNTDLGSFEGYVTSWGAIAGSGSGAINYITPNDGSSSTGYATYADAAGTSPVDGTGGSPSSTFATSTDSSLIGAANYLWTKSANNRQGEGWSYAFSIDSGFQAKPLTISFMYKIGSGTYADGDMTCWIYDVTNSVLIQPSAYSILNTTGVAIQKCEFQASSNSTSYRLIVHTSTTSALAYTVRFDQISVSPNTYNPGAVVTDWAAFTPTGSWSTNTTYTGYQRRVGDTAEYDITLALAGAPTSAALTVNLPVTIDTAKMATTSPSSRQTILGMVIGDDSNGDPYYGAVEYNSTTSVAVNKMNSAGASLIQDAWNATSPTTWASGDKINLHFSVPVVGWGTSQILSSDTDTRIVALTVSGTPASVTSGNPVIFPTVGRDTHGAYSASTGLYTVPVSGFYNVQTYVGTSSFASGNALQIYVNAASAAKIGVNYTLNSDAFGSGTVYANAGDTISVRATANMASMGASNMELSRVSGPAQIAASEKIYLEYTGNGGGAITADVTDIDFITKVSDSHGAWSGTVFTAPRPGWYDASGSVLFTAASTENIYLWVNGVKKYNMCLNSSTSVKMLFAGAYLNTGDTLKIRSDTNKTLSNSSVLDWISITSQG